MANPSPPPASFAAMHTRAGYADGSVLTTAELDQAAAYLVAQDGNGNVQQIAWIYIGSGCGIGTDVNGSLWLTFNAYPNTTGGVTSWYPFNQAAASCAVLLAHLSVVGT